MSAIKAADLAPQIFADGADVDEVAEDVKFDLFNLTAYEKSQVDSAEMREDREGHIHEKAQELCQKLVKRLFMLPTESSEAGPVAELPTREAFLLPRQKKVPEPKPETRWEKFAKDKGITKRKREKMVFDELYGEYRPAHGYSRANNGDLDLPIVEVKTGEDPYADPWKKALQERKEHVRKNEKNRQKNLVRAGIIKKTSSSSSAPLGMPVDMIEAHGKAGPGIGGGKDKDGKTRTLMRGKKGTEDALRMAQFSTASIGRFDEKREGEPERKLKGVKRKFRANTGPNSASEEADAAKRALKSVMIAKAKKEKGVTNSLKQYEGILPDADSTFSRSKGRRSGGSATSFEKNKKRKTKE